MARVSKPDFCRCSWVTPRAYPPVVAAQPSQASRQASLAKGATWNDSARRGVGHCEGPTQACSTEGATVSIFSRHKTTLPSADEALPGRAERPFADRRRSTVVLDAPVVTDEVPEGYEVAIFGLGCFWGAEEIYWQMPGRLVDLGRLRRRHHAEPDVRGGLQRPHRPHRGRAGRLRPVRRVVRRPGQDVLRGPRPDPGHAPGQRRRHPVPLGDLLHDARAGADRARADQGLRRRAAPPRHRRHHHRDPARVARRRTTTPRTTTSSTSRRTRSATAATPTPASDSPRPPDNYWEEGASVAPSSQRCRRRFGPLCSNRG